jgi:lipopolysaccharide export LptBFGC system permease protein LptF
MTQTHTHTKQVDPQKFRARYRNRLAIAFAVALMVSVALQFTFKPHPYFAWDGEYWFYPAFGLLSAVAMVLVSKILGFILKRRENYWEDK